MKLKSVFATVVAVCGFICLPLFLQAQGNPGGDPDVPIDGGVSLLIAAGVAYGAKKAYDKRKKNEGNAQKEK